MGGKVMLSDKFRVSLAHLQVNYIMSLRETARSHCNYGEDIFTRMHECTVRSGRMGTFQKEEMDEGFMLSPRWR